MSNDKPYTGDGEFTDAQRRFLVALLAAPMPLADAAHRHVDAVARELEKAGLVARVFAGGWQLTSEGRALAETLRGAGM